MEKNANVVLILCLVAGEIKKYLQCEHIHVDQQADSKRTILDYLDNRNRMKPTQKREIILSKELIEKISLKKVVNEPVDTNEEIIYKFNFVASKIKNGEDVCFYMSRQIFNSDEKHKDIMLNAWKIAHVHLSDKDTNSKRGMKKNRSEYLLFCIIKKDKVYCVDICKHPERNKFFCYNLLKIIKNNDWMRLVGFEALDTMVDKPLTLKVENDEELTALYLDNKVNLSFEFDGTLYCSIDGITNTGDNLCNVLALNKFQKFLNTNINQNDEVLQDESLIIVKNETVKIKVCIKRQGKNFFLEYDL